MTKQNLKTALTLATKGVRPYSFLSTALDGCPVGGWPQTEQAMRLIADELPAAAARDYTINQFVDAAYEIDRSTDRYRTRR